MARGIRCLGNTLHSADSPGVMLIWNAALGSSAPFASAPATYILKVFPVAAQDGWWTHVFHRHRDNWGESIGAGKNHYGFHPYPDPAPTGAEKWELGSDGVDRLGDLVTMGQWRTQVMRTTAAFLQQFYYDWDNDITKLISHQDSDHGEATDPAIIMLDAPWNFAQEIPNSIIRGLQFYDAHLTDAQINQELANPGSFRTPWYLNLDINPSDILDKSGNNHHPMWWLPTVAVGGGEYPAGLNRPLLWADSGIIPAIQSTFAPFSSTANASTYDSPVYNFTSGRKYLFFCVNSDTAPETDPTGVATVTGGLTFTKLASVGFDTIASNVHRLSLWEATAASSFSSAVRITLADAGTGAAGGMREYQGFDTGTAFGTPVTAQINANAAISATPGALANTDSIVFAVCAHDLNSRLDKPSGTGWVEVHDGVGYATPNTSLEWAENYLGTAQQVTFSGAGSADRALIVVEIRAFPTSTPVESSKALGVETLAAPAASKLVPVESIALPAVSTPARIESLAAPQSSKVAQLEAAAVAEISKTALTDSLGLAAAPKDLLLESTGTGEIAALKVISIESLAEIAAEEISRLESLALVTGSKVARIESKAAPQASRVIRLESYSPIAASKTLRTEAIMGGEIQMGLVLESLSALSPSRVLVLESTAPLAQVSASKVLYLESYSAAAASKILRNEGLREIVAARVIRLEALTAALATRELGLESVGSPANLRALVLESISSAEIVSASKVIYLESLAAVSGAEILAFETLAPVTLGTPQRLESLSTATASRTVLLESVSALPLVEASKIILIESLAAPAALELLRLESLMPIARTFAPRIESLMPVEASHAPLLELLGMIAGEEIAIIESVGIVARAYVIRLESRSLAPLILLAVEIGMIRDVSPTVVVREW